jgi:tubulin polyglutamylase TTLL4
MDKLSSLDKNNDEIFKNIENEAADEDILFKCDTINDCFMLRSIWDGRKGTLFFQYDKSLKKFNETVRSYKIDWSKKENKKFRPTFKAYKNFPLCLSTPIKLNALERTRVFNQTNLIWKFLNSDDMCNLIKSLNKFQRYNHFPTTLQLGRKDLLWQSYKKFNNQYKNDFNFLPESFILPKEKTVLTEAILKDPNQMWVIKPILNSKLKGIKLLTSTEEIPKKCLISKYVMYPHLINEKKYDLRIFVLITSFTPLKIMMFKDGIVRFAQEKYTTNSENKSNKNAHFTNYTNNKPDSDNKRPKWSLFALHAYFINNEIDFQQVYQKIKDIVIKSILLIFEKTIKNVKLLTKHKDVLFELIAFDFVIDYNLKPNLIKININPSLSCDNDIELKLKTIMITDLLNIIGVIPFFHKKVTKTIEIQNEIENMPKNIKQPKTLEQNKSLPSKNKEDTIHINESKISCKITENIDKCKEIFPMVKERRSQSSNYNFRPKVINNEKDEEVSMTRKRKSSFDEIKTESKVDKLENYSTLNSSVSNISFISFKAPSTKVRICKEFELKRNFQFNQHEYIYEYQEMLMDTDDQFSRKGNFELLFPLAENIVYYSQFIKDPKDDNIVLWKWIMSGRPTEGFRNSRTCRNPMNV